ncbi:MAG: hypothetical protein QMC95_03345 [Desulfitobacteriaceae bacterium]|nr:hypothetical protein [Desulfitobacteriaceae bacterium]MDI6879577.1 hypothetical protein [Desulfitobacteriaceae bacterium]MDI6913238.1 hypothetical protein [Desulfitobacteriaceae bacterium]
MSLEPHLNTCKSNQSATPPPTWDVGFRRLASIVESPPYGAGFTSLALFFLILFASDILLRHATLATLGIIVALGTLSLLSLVVLILFVL